MLEQVRVGIVGCGNITATIHLPILMNIPNVSVEYLADLQPPHTLAADFGSRAIGIEKNVPLPDCDVLFLATPVGARKDYIEEFGPRDVFIFAEKPFALCGQQHEEFLSLANNVSCNYMKTTFGSITQLKQIMSSRLFGPLRRVIMTEGGIVGATGKSRTHYQTDPSLSGGGILMERGCHSLSQLSHVLEGFSFSVKHAEIKWINALDIDVETIIDGKGDYTVDIRYHLSLIRPVGNRARFEFETACVDFDHTDPSSRLRVTNRDGDSEFYLDRDSAMASSVIQSFYLKWDSVINAYSGRVPIDSAIETSITTTRLIDSIYEAGGRSIR
jgi:predicted dehydrogenase